MEPGKSEGIRITREKSRRQVTKGMVAVLRHNTWRLAKSPNPGNELAHPQ